MWRNREPSRESWDARGLAIGKGAGRIGQMKLQHSQTYKALERAGRDWCLTEETDGKQGGATGREETTSGNTLDSLVTGHHNKVSGL